MKVVKEDKVKLKKKIIIDALKRCLLKDVYSRITVQDIADEAEFSKGGVLHYFPTKEDIYLELIADIFTGFEQIHLKILEESQKESEVGASLSALVGVETFILDKTNIKIIINLMLYSFEEEKIKNAIKGFLVKHKLFYSSIIRDGKKEGGPTRRRSDIQESSIARIVQTIVLFIGILEQLDPTDMDPYELVKFVATVIK